MDTKFYMNLHLFEGGAGGAGAGAAPAAGGDGAGEAGGEAAVAPGILQDGTQVDDRLAARLEEQARKRKARGEQPAEIPAAMPQEKPAEEPEAEPSLEDQWNEIRKGKFRELYGRDVKAAVDDRFRNQQDANVILDRLQPALSALARQRGLDEDDVDGLIDNILDDDSLYEEEADRMGMTVEGYRNYRAMEAENERLMAQEEQEQEQEYFRQHLMNLAQQGEEMKKIFPNFDLMAELENEQFRRLTAPGSGLDVRAAYYAIHHDELEPQAMAYGIQRAQQQISQTLQANRKRPVEGAMRTGQPADVTVDPRRMTREERQKYIERARRGETIIF